MKKALSVLVYCSLAAAGIVLSSCVKNIPASVVTPVGQTAYTADQIVIRVNELENAAIQAQATGGLSTSTTSTIVRFCVAADMILQTVPDGWQQSLLVAWNQAKSTIPSADIANPVIAASIAAVDVTLAAFSATTGGN